MATYESKDLLHTDHTGRQTFNRNLLLYIWERKNAEFEKLLPKLDDLSEVKNKTDAFGRTLLHYAVEYSNVPIAKYLIQTAGFCVDAIDNFGNTPLLIGLAKKDSFMNRILARHVSEVFIDEEIGKTLLRIVLGDLENRKCIPRLLFPKLKIKSADSTELANVLIAGNCDLCYAVYTENAAVTKTLIDQGCSMETTDTKSNTALHLAVRLGHAENVKLLLERGANVNAQNLKFQIPLNHPSNQYLTADHQEILKLLIDHGSNLSLIDTFGRMQMYVVYRHGTKEAVEILLDSNPDFLARDRYQETILHYLVKNFNPGVFELLVSRNFNANVQCSFGRTPLHGAARLKNEVACKILIDKGADVNATANTTLGIPLFYAIVDVEGTGSEKCVELLLENGANVQFLNRNGLTVFSLLREQILPEVAEVLLGHLALLESLGTTILEPIRKDIESDDSYENHYNQCREQLERMKTDQIYEGITLFKLLTEDEKKVTGYMRNEEILLKIGNFHSNYHFNSYCNKQFHNRITDAIQLAELQQQAAAAVLELIGSKIGFNFVIVNEIVSYLDRRNLQGLLNI